MEPRTMIREKVIRPLPGLPMVLLALGILGINTWLLVNAAQRPAPRGIVLGLVIYVLTAIALGGFLVVQPNEAKVLTLFGNYSGTVTVSYTHLRAHETPEHLV